MTCRSGDDCEISKPSEKWIMRPIKHIADKMIEVSKAQSDGEDFEQVVSTGA